MVESLGKGVHIRFVKLHLALERTQELLSMMAKVIGEKFDFI